MPFFIPLLILFGVSLGATATAVYFDCKTEDEKERQRRIRASHERFVASEGEERVQLARQFANLFLGELEEKKRIMAGVGAELAGAARKLRGHLAGHLTPLREAALHTLLRNLEAKAEKAFANVRYLAWLAAQVEQLLERGETLREVPSLDLPEDFPVRGRVLEFPSSSVTAAFPLPYGPARVVDFERLGDIAGRKKVRLFVHADDHAGESRLSVAGAILHDGFLAEPGAAFDAVVDRIEFWGATLDFCGLKLFLDKGSRIDARSPIFRGAPVRVYPVDWRFDLDWLDHAKTHVVKVSERRESSIRESFLEDVGLVVPDDLAEKFAERYGGLGDSENSWLIQPQNADADEAQPGLLLFQSGEKAFVARVNREAGALRFELKEMLADGGDRFDPAGIYASFDVPITAVAASEYATLGNAEEWRQHFADLDLFLCEEFVSQRHIRDSQAGVTYFSRWGQVLRELIQYKTRLDEGVSASVTSASRTRDHRLYVQLLDSHAVRQYVARHVAEGREYFILCLGKTIIGEAWFDAGDEHALFVRERTANHDLEGSSGAVVRIHAAVRPYPEIQQRRAIEALRRGDVVNPAIRDLLHSPKTAQASRDAGRVLADVPETIASNASQKDILAAIHAERNLYCVQGPPGAGKTTIILETIHQHLRVEPQARILVVSQSNVAVDHVLKGLAKDPAMRGKLLRVGGRGAGTRIDRELLELGVDIDARHRAYIARLTETEPEARLRDLRAAWIEQVGQELSPDLADMLVAQHQIVGATCVGLANRQLDLTRREFDLVLVDETARATPGELLIPLLRARKAVLIGDQKQLPPTIDACLRNDEYPLSIEQVEVRAMYAETLFERLFDALEPVGCAGRLRRQYRMVPDIGAVVSSMFYDGALENDTKTTPPLLMEHPLTWVDTAKLCGFRSRRSGKSQVNTGEVDIVLSLVAVAHEVARGANWGPVNIAVITSYSAQKQDLERACKWAAAQGSTSVEVRVDTVDAFQGNEADIVVFCTTRSTGSIRFLNDPNRLNVALSRAKRELVIVGDAGFLMGADTGGEPNLFGHLYSQFERQKVVPLQVTETSTEALLPAIARDVRRHFWTESVVKAEHCGPLTIAIKGMPLKRRSI
jgi:hypothetical protein